MDNNNKYIDLTSPDLNSSSNDSILDKYEETDNEDKETWWGII